MTVYHDLFQNVHQKKVFVNGSMVLTEIKTKSKSLKKRLKKKRAISGHRIKPENQATNKAHTHPRSKPPPPL
jgi:hypothetical protein